MENWSWSNSRTWATQGPSSRCYKCRLSVFSLGRAGASAVSCCRAMRVASNVVTCILFAWLSVFCYVSRQTRLWMASVCWRRVVWCPRRWASFYWLSRDVVLRRGARHPDFFVINSTTFGVATLRVCLPASCRVECRGSFPFDANSYVAVLTMEVEHHKLHISDVPAGSTIYLSTYTAPALMPDTSLVEFDDRANQIVVGKAGNSRHLTRFWSWKVHFN
jgi:hypothetical protein